MSFPKQDHPLTLAYLAAVRCRSPEDMKQAMLLIRSLEKDAPEIIRHQCKLAAEVLLERKI